jgi:hypothetical protein
MIKMSKLTDFIEQTAKENPLCTSRLTGDGYFDGFLHYIFNPLNSELSCKNMKAVLTEKLQLGKQTFDEQQYLQGATELTVIAKFHSVLHDHFGYEEAVEQGKKKQPECILKANGFTLNVEAKCPDLSKSRIPLVKQNGMESVELNSFGRIPDYPSYSKKLAEDLAEFNPELSVHQKKNKDNTLKDFLYSAHDKFVDNRDESELNILVVSLGDIHNQSAWYGYLVAYGGAFKKEPLFVDPQKFSRVDAIVYTNLQYRHKNHVKIENSPWSFDDAFCIFSSSPYRQSNKEAPIRFLSGILKSHTEDLLKYKKSKEYKTNCGPMYEEDPDALLLPSYKSEIEKKGLYYWEKKE